MEKTVLEGIVKQRSKTGIKIGEKWGNYSQYANYNIPFDSVKIGDRVSLWLNDKGFVTQIEMGSATPNSTQAEVEMEKTNSIPQSNPYEERDGNIRRANQMNIIIPTVLSYFLSKAKDNFDAALVVSQFADLVVNYSNDLENKLSLKDLLHARIGELDTLMSVNKNGTGETESLSKTSS